MAEDTKEAAHVGTVSATALLATGDVGNRLPRPDRYAPLDHPSELIDVTRESQTVELNITRVVGDTEPRRPGQRSNPSASLGVLLGAVHKDCYLAEI